MAGEPVIAATVDRHRRAVDEFDRRARAIRDDQWHLPTPCTDWSVRDLVNHLVYEDLWTPELFSGKTVADVGDRYEGDLLGNDPRGAWEAAKSKALAAVQQPGALERQVHVSWGQISGEEYALQLFNDHLIHAWDLARAIGADERLDPELVEASYQLAKPREDELKQSGVFGPRVEPPPGADRQVQLLAIFGRRA
jgi:uncharacterized protein (TIGR03086 family)